jgi:hypothetical protein
LGRWDVFLTFNKTVVGAGRGGDEMTATEKSCRRRGGLVWMIVLLEKTKWSSTIEGFTSLKAMRKEGHGQKKARRNYTLGPFHHHKQQKKELKMVVKLQRMPGKITQGTYHSKEKEKCKTIHKDDGSQTSIPKQKQKKKAHVHSFTR